jgi:hypothetical protein
MPMKTCAACGRNKELTAFAIRRRSLDGRYYYCKECDKAKAAAWRHANRQRHCKATAEWRAKNPEWQKRNVREWAQKNPQRKRELAKRSYEKHKERYAKKSKMWRAENKSRILLLNKRRLGRLGQATPPWLTAIQKAQIDEYYEIAAARTTQLGVRHEVDHIHPLWGRNFRGLHVPWNLQVLTASENRSKRTRLDV